MPSYLFLAAQIAVAIESARIAFDAQAEQLGLAIASVLFPAEYAAELRRTAALQSS